MKNIKERLVESATALFSEKGYHKTNTNEIANKAEVAVGSFYQYFPDKKSIFIELVKRHLDEIDRDFFSKEISQLVIFNDEREVINTLIRNTYFYYKRDMRFHVQAEMLIPSIPEIGDMYSAHDERMTAKSREMLLLFGDRLSTKNIDDAVFIINTAIESVVQEIIAEHSGEREKRLLSELSDMIHRYLFRGKQ